MYNVFIKRMVGLLAAGYSVSTVPVYWARCGVSPWLRLQRSCL